MGRHDFTLVELLVCIVIITILASILLPSLATARKKVLTLNCASNLRQLSVCYLNYAEDFKGYGPKNQNHSAGLFIIKDPIQDYLPASKGLLKIGRCPLIQNKTSSDKNLGTVGTSFGDTYWTTSYVHSFGFVSSSSGFWGWDTGYANCPRQLININWLERLITVNAAGTYVVNNKTGAFSSSKTYGSASQQPIVGDIMTANINTTSITGAWANITIPHKGLDANVVYADGHVRHFTRPQAYLNFAISPYKAIRYVYGTYWLPLDM